MNDLNPKLEYNAANLEMVLFFYDIPDKLIKKSEAESIAKELQRIDPDNTEANSVCISKSNFLCLVI